MRNILTCNSESHTVKRMKTFGQQLREAMGSLTQDELAAKTRISQGTISRHIAGKSRPDIYQVEAYERVLPRLSRIRKQARQAVSPDSDIAQAASGL